MAQEEAMTSYSPPSLEEREAAKASDPDSSNVNIIQEIEDVTKEHEGWYTCMAGNVQGTWGGIFYLTLITFWNILIQRFLRWCCKLVCMITLN